MRLLRKTIFWLHLVVGLAAGLGVALMAVTGIILSFEHQIMESIERHGGDRPNAQATVLPIETLLRRAHEIETAKNPNAIMLFAQTDAPAAVVYGPERWMLLNAYTGELISDHGRVRAFFRFVTELHRWLTLSEPYRQTGKYITGWVTLAFLLLIVSGLSLWLPRKLKWQSIRPVLLLNFRLRGKPRDWNWHNVLGLWAAVPLIIISITGTVIAFQWASDLVLRAAGDTPPKPAPPAPPRKEGAPAAPPRAPNYAGFNAAWHTALAHAGNDWTAINLRPAGSTVKVLICTGDPEVPYNNTTLTIDRKTSEVTKTETFDTMTPGRKARSLALPIHRGLIVGVFGQIVMCAASLATLVLIYTGFALSYRRLLRPLLASRARSAQASASLSGSST